jgi:hypothetical protein
MGSPSQFAHLTTFASALRKPGLIPFGTFNAADAAWLDNITDMPGGSSGGDLLSFATVPWAASLTVDVSVADVISVTLSGNVTSSSLNFSGGTPPLGQQVEWRIIQNGVGAWTFAFPPNVVLDPSFVIDPDANSVTVLNLVWNGSAWLATSVAFSAPAP